MQLVQYRNPGRKVYNGECCDNIGWCIDSCDTYFKFCLTPQGSTLKCVMGITETSVLGHDSFRLAVGERLGGGLKNPLSYNFAEWTVRTKLVFYSQVTDGAGVILKCDKKNFA